MTETLSPAAEEKPWLRPAIAIALASVAWWVVLRGSMFVLKATWPEFAAAFPERAFSLPMLWVRLVVFAGTVAVTSAVATRVSERPWMPGFCGIVIFVASIPDHLYPGFVWDKYPVWYHLTYLAYIIPVAWLGGRTQVRSGTG